MKMAQKQSALDLHSLFIRYNITVQVIKGKYDKIETQYHLAQTGLYRHCLSFVE